MKNALRLFVLVGILAIAVACADRKEAAPAASDVPGVCVCITQCAKTTNIEDPSALVTCQKECAKRFGDAALAAGLKRSMEVMTGARESCAD